MAKFRHNPSKRKTSKLTASWLILGPTTASSVKHGHTTTHIIPCKPSHHRRRYHEGQRLAVKAYVGGPTECRVNVTTAQQVQLGDLDYPTIRRLGYVRLDQFQVTWVEEHDLAWWNGPAQDTETITTAAVDRFHARHAHKPVWLLEFTVDRTQPARLLAARSDELYVTTTATALADEPEALTEDQWKRHVDRNKDLTHEHWLAFGRMASLDEKRRPHKHQRKAAA